MKYGTAELGLPSEVGVFTGLFVAVSVVGSAVNQNRMRLYPENEIEKLLIKS